MEKIINVNAAELTVGENVRETETVKIPKFSFVKELAESYRSRLLENYKMYIIDNYENENDLTEELMREAVMIMDASEEEILKMFFEDAYGSYPEINKQAYFNQLFEVATPFPYSTGN
ncbi:hypothetical protein M3193_02120 [Sporosarcina luteola]|uniref:hypothetical protein n=1 Tax=Sporosarcina luteola TaxID=582850 RepID=UPI00203AB7B6|nr:hypothetical protein [Sporosarcina luteola]MCM3742928.1 hypothetical protein [Sporosarcina luteola]